MTIQEIYDRLGVFPDKLGCVMADTEPLKISDMLSEEDLYYAKEKDRFWIDGVVSEKVCHVTLLYGLMQSARDWKEYVDALLKNVSIKDVEIDQVSYFDSPYENEPYFCLVAKLVVSDELLAANGELRKLPHCDSYALYTPHITLAYIKKDPKIRDELLYAMNNRFVGMKVKTTGLNYGR